MINGDTTGRPGRPRTTVLPRDTARTPRTAPPPPVTDGRSTRWDDHRAIRRAELVHAARKAVHKGGPGVSMDEIAAASGTSKSIIYRYFEDKTGLQIAIGASVVGQMHDALTQAAESAETPAGRCAPWSASTSR